MSSTTKKQLAAGTTALLGVFAFQPTAAAEQKFQKLTGAQNSSEVRGHGGDR
jgi:predicted polyphosphate/ATP-dependent NAD kinase